MHVCINNGVSSSGLRLTASRFSFPLIKLFIYSSVFILYILLLYFQSDQGRRRHARRTHAIKFHILHAHYEILSRKYNHMPTVEMGRHIEALSDIHVDAPEPNACTHTHLVNTVPVAVSDV